jgi:membrane-bound metal-dependent hydrolase YbcI (DUF457 family)
LIDIGWSGLIIAGVERVSFDPSLPGSALVLEHMPWTHSLPAALAWALAAALAGRGLLKLPWRAAIVVGLVVFSHWLLDLLVHRPDLALWPQGPKVGLGLWNHEVAEQAVEIGLLALAGMAWTASRKAVGRFAWPAVLFVFILIAVQLIAMGVPGGSATGLGISALAVYLSLAVIAWLVDRGQRERRA